MLIKTAKAIKQGCRSDEIIARLGGDEFIVILPNTDEIKAKEIIDRIQIIIGNEKINDLDISISFGYSTKVNEEQSIQNIFKFAENRMYKHKLYESTSARNKTINLISNTMFAKSNRELIHSEKVSELCEIIAIAMNYNHNTVKKIKLAGLMHDIGKIGISDKILNKKGKLTKREYIEIKRHPEIGFRILSSSNEFSEISEYVLQHHERWDGSGYPQKLKGKEIKIEARIISIADSYAAMTNQRSYGLRLSKEDALSEIKRCSGTQFDPRIVKVFIEVSKDFL
jgi:HD-GYP domain-containing protein (c-di-GMP phosphodiesterase class II)